MKRLTVALCILVPSLLAAQAVPDEENTETPEVMAHPGAVALSESQPGQWSYKSFPGLRPLYVNEKDSDGKSHCYDSCAAAWPPLFAEQQEAEIGHWSVIRRDTGELQWAYKGQPVHRRFHDSAANPRGDGIDGFRLLEP